MIYWVIFLLLGYALIKIVSLANDIFSQNDLWLVGYYLLCLYLCLCAIVFDLYEWFITLKEVN